MSIISVINKCRICQQENLINVIDLGEQVITSRFPVYGDHSTPIVPITLCMCRDCGLLQLRQTTFSSELYEYEYGYRSGISNTMRSHLKQYQDEILTKVKLNDGDTIVDIGSNDSTMLQYYSDKLKRIGVDPTGKQFKQYYGDVELIPDYFTYDNFTKIYGDRKCKLVSSISMFYDLPDPVQFAKDIYSILEADGIWSCEQSYMLTMLRRNSIDTICHEHLEYYVLKQIKEIADRSNFKIIDVKFNDCNGGSFRVYFAKRESQAHEEAIHLVNNIIESEEEYGIMNPNIYKDFIKRCDDEVNKLCDFIDCVNKNNQKMYIYGASTKGNCLLQYANIGEEKIDYAVERNLNKVGKMTSTGIEIISEEKMRQNPPEYLLVLPWHFRTEIIERERDFLDNGGQLVFPFPHFDIVSSKPKLLITGCDGQIAHYVKKQYVLNQPQRDEEKDIGYTLYGIGHQNEKYEKNITKFYFDLNDYKLLEHTLSIIKPDIIVHLAGISSSHYALNHPIETLQTNGLVTAYLCQIIHQNKLQTKLFNASSSEIYKGHVDYTVQEHDSTAIGENQRFSYDINMYHPHPYAIAKIMGHSIIDFYRTTYNLPFSNGVIYTTESVNKNDTFLLKKVANHIKEWKDREIPLVLGNLDSYRNILHASDVASAIHYIIRQNKGDNYLICNYSSVKVYDLVLKLYSKAGIDLTNQNNMLYDKHSSLPVVIIDDDKNLEVKNVNIKGSPTKLTKLGWKPLVTLDKLLDEFLQ